jgi:serine/threonine protein kinase
MVKKLKDDDFQVTFLNV